MQLRRQLFTSSLWSILGTAANLVSSFVVFVLLARLLTPREFGLVAFVALFVDLARGLMMGGMAEALVQRKTWDETAASTAFFANVVAGVALMLAIGGGGWAAAAWSGQPEMAAIFAVLSVSLLVDSLRGVHEAKLRRDFGYKQLALRTVATSLVSGVIGVVLAMSGYGVWALVANRMAASVLQTVVIWLAGKWRPKLLWSGKELKSLAGFGLHMMGARLFGQLNTKAPEFIIGFFIGPAGLAYFRVGSRALNLMIQATIAPLQTTALSALSRLKDEAAVGAAYVRMTRVTALVSAPVFIGAAAVAHDFIPVFFGEQWAPSAPVMAALAMVVAASTLLYFAQPALAATGRASLVLYSNLVVFGLNAIVALGTVWFGVLAVAVGQTARAYVSAPFALLMLKRGVGVPIGRAIASIVPPLVCALIMGAVVVGARLYLLDAMVQEARLAISIVIGGAVYLLCLLTIGRRFLVSTLTEAAAVLPKPLLSIARRLTGQGPA